MEDVVCMSSYIRSSKNYLQQKNALLVKKKSFYFLCSEDAHRASHAVLKSLE